MKILNKKRDITIIVIAVVSLILLFPIRLTYEDGGTVDYKAILYSITFWHRIDENYETGIYEATEFEIFPFNWINIK